MQLSKRLEAVAGLVTKGNRLADIGCDHAHVSISLAQKGSIPSGIAMDINAGPLERARENICHYGLSGRLETRRSDGAKELACGEADTILISGMGGGLIVKILSESQEAVISARELVLQPQSEIGSVRHCIHTLGFCIVEEFMLAEDGKRYTGMKAIKGQERYGREIFYRYGKLLLEGQNCVLKEFLEYKKKRYESVAKELKELKKLKGQAAGKNEGRLLELFAELASIEEALAYYT